METETIRDAVCDIQDTPSISYTIQHIINDAKITSQVTGTIIKLSNKLFLITVNHGLPIIKLCIKDKLQSSFNNSQWSESLKQSSFNNSQWSESLKQSSFNNSQWSESLIIPFQKDIDISNYIIFTKWQISVPHILNDMYTIINNKLVSLTYVKVHYEPLHLFKNNPYTIYIIAELPKGYNYELVSGNSGAPVFIKTPTGNKLIGILTKHHKLHNVIYIIPIHIFMKSIEKQDNINIYGINTAKISNINNITKIGRYKIFQDLLYGPMVFDTALRCRIPLTAYFLIYGDINKKYNITFRKNGETLTEVIDAYIINNQLPVSQEIQIIKQNNKYKVTIGLLHVLKITHSKLLPKLFDIINKRIELNETNDFWISIKLT
jgi:hypothetical protein